MLKTRRANPILILLIALFSMACTFGAGDSTEVNSTVTDIKDTVKKSFKVRPGGTLFVDIDHGNVDVRSHSGSEVLVEVERTVQTDNSESAKQIFNRHELAIEERSSNVYIESRYDRDGGFWGKMTSGHKLKIRVLVRVPREYDIDFSSGAGNVEIGDLSGRVSGSTGAGNVIIGAVKGKLKVSSGTGNMRIEGAEGSVEASTGAGNIEVRDVKGDVRIDTGAGNIEVFITEQPRDDSRLSTGAGNVTVYIASRVGVDVNAETGVGSASTDFPLKVEGSFMKKSFAGDVNGGGPALRMRAGVGNVTLKKI
ncbi:MAG: DUF4097 family beta strand repeat-containing protein [Rhodothermales bacterium]